MARTKFQTDVLNVASLVKSILDATTASAIRTLLGLVIGTDVQAYNANILTTTSVNIVTNKRITPRSISIIAGASDTIPYSGYLCLKYSLSGDITFSSNTGADFETMMVGLDSDSSSHNITWNTGFDGYDTTLPVTIAANTKIIVIFIWLTDAWHCSDVIYINS